MVALKQAMNLILRPLDNHIATPCFPFLRVLLGMASLIRCVRLLLVLLSVVLLAWCSYARPITIQM